MQNQTKTQPKNHFERRHSKCSSGGRVFSQHSQNPGLNLQQCFFKILFTNLSPEFDCFFSITLSEYYFFLFIKCVFNVLIEELYSFQMQIHSGLNLSLKIGSIMSHKFGYVLFSLSFSSKKFCMSFLISIQDLISSSSELFSFYEFVYFLVIYHKSIPKACESQHQVQRQQLLIYQFFFFALNSFLLLRDPRQRSSREETFWLIFSWSHNIWICSF